MADSSLIGYIDGMIAGGRDLFNLQTVGDDKDVALEANGYILKMRGFGDIDILGRTYLNV